MSVFTLRAEKIVSLGLGLLQREITLPALVWRDGAAEFTGAKDDTVTVRMPAYTEADSRAMRSGDTRSRRSLAEQAVKITLDTDIYRDVRLTDENLTLDIIDFGSQVLTPCLSAIARGLENTLVSTITDADYELELELDESDPYKTIVAARKALNNTRVPANGRALAVGSNVEELFLLSEQFARADKSGSTDALRDASIGRVAGFPVFSCPALDPDEAYAFHKSAFVLASRAPVVPAGAPFGATASDNGFAIRVVRVLDSEAIEDILALDAFVGSTAVTDRGVLAENGVFTPSESSGDDDSSASPLDESGVDDVFVRAVKITRASSS
jgi:hypothetical protein